LRIISTMSWSNLKKSWVNAQDFFLQNESIHGVGHS
jgi:hypothetical protein